MNCSDFHNLLDALLAARLAAGDRARLEAHADRCPACADELRLWTEGADALLETTPPVAPPAALRAEVLTRALGRVTGPDKVSDSLSIRGATPGRDPGPDDGPRRAAWRWWGAVAAGLLVSFGLGRGVATLTAPPTVVGVAERAPGADAGAIAQRERLLAQGAGAAMPAVTLVAASGRAEGRLVVDGDTGELHFYAVRLGPPPDGSEYCLWFRVDGAWRLAGALRPERGAHLLVGPSPRGWSAKAPAVVTLEPVGGADEGAGPTLGASPTLSTPDPAEEPPAEAASSKRAPGGTPPAGGLDVAPAQP